MRVLQLIQKQQYRGAEVFSCQLSNHLIRHGHEVEVMSIFDGDAELPFKGILRSLSGNEKWRYTDFKGWKKLASFIEVFKPDIVQANAADTLKYAVCSKILHNWEVPVIYRNASSPSFYINDPFAKAFNAFLLKRVDMILSVSQASKKDLNDLYSFTSGKTFVVPVGVEEQEVLKDTREDGLKHILHIGSFTKEKNHLELLEIFEKVLRENPHVVLDLVGEGPLFEKVQQHARENKLEDKVNFIGGVENPISYVQSADVIVLPSLIEGLPGVLLEAMYCRIPVVAYDVGGVGEIVSARSGNLIAKNDSGAFVEKLKEILEEPDEEQVEESYRMVQKDFLNSGIALKFIQFYEKVISQ